MITNKQTAAIQLVKKDYKKCSSGIQANLKREYVSATIKKKNSVVLVHKRTIPTERSPPVSEASANFSG
jgi:hypothetical protein